MSAQIDEIYQSESRRVFATLVRLLGDFDLAEEALHEGFTAAVLQWPREGIPKNPRAWIGSSQSDRRDTPTESEIEIRPFYEVEDFGEAFTPELQAQE